MNEESLFAAAVEKANPAERQAFLDEACGGDDALRRRVERLLCANEHAGGILDRGADGDFALGPEQTVAEGPGTVVGRYKLKEQIGEGGFGLVFVAEQQQPVRRKVALKVIKPGMDTREVIARFEAERQALALMDHPNIAHVIDAGATDSGRPYFVMELVRGVAVTEFCDQHQLETRERLELFISVCRAVQHAHQKGIIHRDLKPSNVLVTLYDGKAVVKVIDFGVAKALNQQLTEHSIYTRFAQMIGTPLYMSPEQAELSGLDVDTRADIYSLGVLLYELLTGTTPFDKERLKTAGFDEIRRIIREEEPPRPSTRISTLGQAATTVSANRRSDPKRLSRSLRGELDWIAMKALEKDRTRRYETAAEMARDVQRYLGDEPVEASPPSTAYRLKKFLRRNRGPVLATSIIFLVLVGGVIGTTLGMISAQLAQRAEAERAEAEVRERLRAEAAETEAKENEKKAKVTAEIAKGIVRFFRQGVLGQAGSSAQAGRQFEPNPTLTVREALDRAAATVGDDFKNQPEVEAAVRKTVGEAYRHLGQYDKAIAQLRRAADIRARYHGPNHLDTLDTLHSLAIAYRDAGKTAEAIRLYEQVRDAQIEKLGPENAHTLTTLDNLAVAYRDARRTAEARALHQRVREARIRTLGPDDPATLFTLHNLATMDLNDGKIAEAIAQFERIRDARLKVLPSEHPDHLPTLNNLAVAYWKANQLDKSVPLFEKLLPLHQKILGEMHPDTLMAVANLGVNYRDADRFEEAIPLLKRAYDGGRTHASLRFVGGELLIAYARAGKSAEAMPLIKENLATGRKAHPAGSPQLGNVLSQNGLALLELKAWAEAVPILRECVAIRQSKEPDDWRTFNAESMLGEALLGQSKYADAEPLLLHGYEGMKQRTAKVPASSKFRLTEALTRLVRLYDAWDKPAEAAKWRKELDSVGKAAEKPAGR